MGSACRFHTLLFGASLRVGGVAGMSEGYRNGKTATAYQPHSSRYISSGERVWTGSGSGYGHTLSSSRNLRAAQTGKGPAGRYGKQGPAPRLTSSQKHPVSAEKPPLWSWNRGKPRWEAQSRGYVLWVVSDYLTSTHLKYNLPIGFAAHIYSICC